MGKQERHTLENRAVDVPTHFPIAIDDQIVGHIDVYGVKKCFSGEVLLDPAKAVLAETSNIIGNFFRSAYQQGLLNEPASVTIDELLGGVLLPGVPYKVSFQGKF